MGLDFQDKKLEENRDNTRVNMSSNNSSACDPSSSGFNSPFGSELDSSGSEDGDFTAELSRQMAEFMLHEEEEEDTNWVTHSSPLQAFRYGSNSNRPVLDHADRTPCIKLKSQSPVGVWRGRRAELSRKTQQNYGRYRDGEWRNGSGMRAVFLGGSGPTYGSSGTGVFLPRVANNDPAEQKKKSGLSTVLIPTRVLEALEHHFTRLSPSSHYASPRDEWVRSKGNKRTKLEMDVGKNKLDEIQILPQEWTY